MMADNGNWHFEVQSRVASMHAALTPVKRCVRATTLLDIGRRKVHAESLALSRLAFNSGVWPRLTKRAEAAFKAAYVQLYRAALGVAQANNASAQDVTQDILAQVERPCHVIFLRASWLFVLVRAVQHGPRELLQTLDAGVGSAQSWVGTIQLDVLWLAQMTADDRDLEIPRTFSEWLQFARQNSAAFRALVKKSGPASNGR